MTLPDRILVIDDDAALRRITARVLRTAGYEALEAETGEAGLELARQSHPALILLDVVLPDIDGIELCQRIKADPALANCAVILLSGVKTSSDNQSTGLEAGADGYIVRPIANRELAARVEAALRLRRAEVAAQQAERRYRELFDQAPMMYVVTRGSERGPIIADCNDTFLNALGYSRDEVIGHLLADFYTPASRAALLKGDSYQRALQGIFTPEERELVARDGHIVQTLLRAVPERDERGIAIGTRAMFVDITERKQAETRLLFQAHLLDTVGEALIATDAEGTVIYMNRAAETLYGWPASEAIGRNTMEINVPQVSQQQAAEVMAALRAGQNWSGEFWVKRRDGSEFFAMVTDAPVRDPAGRIIGIIGVSRDITELKRIEQSLRAAAQEWQTTFDAVNDAIWLLDADNRIQRANQAACQLFGEVVGRHCWEIVHGATQPPPQCPIVRVKATLRRESIELPMDGRWFLVTVDPILDAAGRYAGAVHIISDMTARKQAELKLAEQLDELRRWYTAMLGREGRVLELKREVNELLTRLGEPMRYLTSDKL